MYRYRAVNPAGETEEGEMDVPLESLALARLQDQGYVPIRVELVARAARRPLPFFERRRRTMSRRDVELMTTQLATLLEAGTPLDQCFATLAEICDGEAQRRAVEAVHERIRGGASLSAALADEPAFSPFQVNMVRAGEAAGTLDTTLKRLAEHMQRARELRDGVVSALIYPLILVGVAAVSVLLLLGMVLPQFAEMFADLDAALPLSTRFVLAAGDLARGYWWAVPALAAGAALAARAWLEEPGRRLRMHERLLRVPLLGELVCKVEVAAFTRGLSTMIGNGVPLLTALAIVKDGMGNEALANAAARAHEQLEGGAGLAAPLAASGVFPKLAVRMIRVGEESGRLEEMLARLADVYERETQVAVKRLLNVIEPALIVGLGAIIAGIIVSVLSAVFGMNELVI